MCMSNAKYRFYYINGEIEELETENQYNEDARSKLNLKLTHNPTWMYVGGKHINLANVISIEVVGEKEKMELNLNLKLK